MSRTTESSAIGSGGAYALAAARALVKYTDLSAREIAQEAMQIAGKICIYTNENISHRRAVNCRTAPLQHARIQLICRMYRKPVDEAPHLDELTPREIVRELDKYVIGQAGAKRAVAIALRNRIRRQKLPPEMAEEVMPKNIIMIGPDGRR